MNNKYSLFNFTFTCCFSCHGGSYEFCLDKNVSCKHALLIWFVQTWLLVRWVLDHITEFCNNRRRRKNSVFLMCIVFAINWMSINSDFFLIWGLNYDMDMFLADLPVTSVSEIMFYTYVILNLTRPGAVFSKSLLITVAFNENYMTLKPKLTCYSIIGVLGFSFESKTLRLLPVGVHVRLGWVALSLCGSKKEEKKNVMEYIILTCNLWILWLTEKVQRLYGLIF